MQHRTITPARHADSPNPLIDLAETPFVLPAVPLDWEPAEPGGRLRAGLSSFGAGGANAHLVIEDYPDPPRRVELARPDLVLLSACDAERLRVTAEALLAAIRRDPMPLADVAHTLRVGRQAMAARLAILAEDERDLETKLAGWLSGVAAPAVLSGAVTAGATRRLSETAEGQAAAQEALQNADLPRLASLWVAGAEIDWEGLSLPLRPRLVALPGYPFRRERYWLPVVAAPVATVAPAPAPAPPAAALAEAAQPEPVQAEPVQAEPLQAEGRVRTQLFARIWQPAPVGGWRAGSPPPVFVLTRDDDLGSRLGERWDADVVVIRPDGGFAASDGGMLRMNPAEEADHAALIAHLARRAPGGFALVQALDWPCAGPGEGSGDAAMATVLLIQAAQRAGIAELRILHLFADGDDRPLDQAVGALARSAMQEGEGCRLRAVGIAGAADAAAAAAICRDELLAADDAAEVFYSGGRRQVPAIAVVEADPSAATIGFRIGGAYLLVGGLGEVGCALAERLGRDYRARIAIIGRSDPRGAALKRLNRLRESGLQVQYEACDLTDRDGLARALSTIRAQCGRLHGVMHLARTVEDALLVRKSAASVRRVMAAKVAGSIALDAALADEPLDWFVLCSSLAAWLGLAGGGDYALACAFQNGFARLRQQKVERGERSGRTVAICWPQWQHDRYLNESKLRRLAAEGLQTIDARDGLRIIAQVLQSDQTEVAAVKGNERALHRLTLAYAPTRPADAFAAELRGLSDAALAAYLDYLGAVEPQPEAPAQEKPPLPAAPAASPEELVLDTVCDFLKLPPERFAADSAFAEFGLDSIKALHLAERLQVRLGVPVDPAMFYEFPTVSALVQGLAGRSGGALVRALP
jgi:acyl carrier protein